MTPEEWSKCVTILRAVYPTSFKGNAETIGVWFDLLADLDGRAVLAAIAHMAKTTEAFPSVAEIRKLANPRRDHGEAWGELLRAISSTGQYPVVVNGTLQPPGPQFSDPLIGEAVKQLGGWVHLCQTMQTEDEPTWRAQFRKVYDALQARAEREQTFQALGVPSAPQALNQAPARPLLGGA